MGTLSSANFMNIAKPTIRVTNLHIMSIRMIPTRILSLRSVCRYNAAISKGFQVRCASQAVAAEKLNEIVSDISQLTLIEVAELNKLLKTALNILQAKKFVENLPAVVRADIPKEEAEKLKETI